MRLLIITVLVMVMIVVMVPSVHAEEVPDWVKNTAGWWATDDISETEFVNAIEFLIGDGIININSNEVNSKSQVVPDWVKNTAGWWATDDISETEFVNAIEFLVNIGLIKVESSISLSQLSYLWKNGELSDKEFLEKVKNQDGQKYFVDDLNLKIPEWLENNAGWISARILTDSDYKFNQDYTNKKLFACDNGSLDFKDCNYIKNNSHGFRGIEFDKNKPNDIFRIVAVGGSTTWGAGESNNNLTWPAHLEKIILENTAAKIEVINAGISGFKSEKEFFLIRDKIVNYDPDLIIMYDGYNDHHNTKVEDTVQNWKKVCQLGQNQQFDTIVIVQPLPIGNYRVLTEQEIVNSDFILEYPRISQKYVENFPILEKDCNDVFDFRYIFDYVQEPIFWDRDHSKSNGNFIIAENVFEKLSMKYFDKKYTVNKQIPPYQNLESSDRSDIYAVGSDLNSMDFTGLDLKFAIFDYANLNNSKLQDSDIKNARFYWASLSNVDLSGMDLTGTKLKGANLSDANLSNVDLSGMDLTGTNLSNVDLSGMDLTGTNLSLSDLTQTDFSGSNLKLAKMANSNLMYTDFSDSNLLLCSFSESDLIQTKLPTDILRMNFNQSEFHSVDFSNKIIQGTTFGKSNFTNTSFENTIGNPMILELTISDLSILDLPVDEFMLKVYGSTPATEVEITEYENYLIVKSIMYNDFSLTDLESANFKNSNFSYTAFSAANLLNADFENSILSQSYFEYSVLKNANFKSADLTLANLEGANLEGANLEGANLEGANLEGANLEGANLKCKGHEICI